MTERTEGELRTLIAAEIDRLRAEDILGDLLEIAKEVRSDHDKPVRALVDDATRVYRKARTDADDALVNIRAWTTELEGPIDDEALFARRIRRFRLTVGISQTGLAKVLGVDPTAITKIENGTRSVRLNEAAAIARTLGIPLTDLIHD